VKVHVGVENCRQYDRLFPVIQGLTFIHSDNMSQQAELGNEQFGLRVQPALVNTLQDVSSFPNKDAGVQKWRGRDPENP